MADDMNDPRNKRKRPERINRVGLADPRTGGERVAAMINRVASGNMNSPVRKWDDDWPGVQRRTDDKKRKR